MSSRFETLVKLDGLVHAAPVGSDARATAQLALFGQLERATADELDAFSKFLES